jgi:hypothetical protein
MKNLNKNIFLLKLLIDSYKLDFYIINDNEESIHLRYDEMEKDKVSLVGSSILGSYVALVNLKCSINKK